MRNPSFKVAAAVFSSAALLKVSALAVAVAILGGLASSAQASSLGRPCTSAPESQWLSMQDLQAKVEALGYKVQKAKLAKACGEFYTLDKNGNRVELFVDPTSGQIVGQL
jgi:hypothetical protein